MIIEYNEFTGIERFAHSSFDLMLLFSEMTTDYIEKTVEKIKNNEDIMKIYFAQDFIEHDKFFDSTVELINGFIFTIHVEDNYVDKYEEYRFRYAKTILTITRIQNGVEDKTIEMIPWNKSFESVVGTTSPSVTLSCLFSGIINRALNISHPLTDEDYDEWLNNPLDEPEYFYHREQGMTEEQLEFLIAFSDESLRKRLIQDVSKRLNKKWEDHPPHYDEEPQEFLDKVEELKKTHFFWFCEGPKYKSDEYYDHLHIEFKHIIYGETKAGLTDYDVIASSFVKAILEEEMNRFKNDNNEQAVAFLEECLKRYKE